ncbi:MAG: PBP1A family penicillin-binding protein [Actinomycetota bacterium]|nr:PBP1A family penicillin-binding protein [Actinomycetota bacterium]
MLRRRPARAPKHSPRRRIRKLRLAVLVAVLGLLSLSAFTFGLVSAIASEIPKLDPRNQQHQPKNGYIYASDGKTILAVLRGEESRVLVDSDEIDPVMKQAIVAIEDRRFYEHRGLDLRGIGRALWADISNKSVIEGGSTITQQYVKRAYVGDQRSIARKVREAALAWQLERQWDDKDRILTAYLNTIYYGNGAYGIQQAAKVYFDHGAAEMTLAEAALLAGIPKDPSTFDPVTQPEQARQRRRLVLRAMLAEGYITASDFRAADRTPLPSADDVRLPGIQGPAPYFTNYVKEQLLERYEPREVYGGGLRITTTIDLEVQKLAQDAIAEVLPEEVGPTAALVAIDPTTGDVLAMVGGRNYRKSQFNLAVQGQRQPGSAFKPFVLAAALQHGIAPATRFDSEPVTIPLGDRTWSVSNYEDAYLGSVDLAQATIHSDNAVYAQLARLVGIPRVINTARNLGVDRRFENFFSLALGAQAVSPLDLARAYSPFANGGWRIDTRTFGNRARVVHRIVDDEGDLLVGNDFRRRRVLSDRTAGIVNQLLQGVIASGTGERAALDGWPAAGKTGTTENYGDAWFVGYTPQLVAAVWIGYPTTLRPMLTEYDGEPVTGGSYPAELWKAFMERALPQLEKEPVGFPAPSLGPQLPQMVLDRDGRIMRDNGLCRFAREVVYFSGFGPKRTASCKPNEVEVPKLVGSTLTEAEARLAAQPLTPRLVYKPARPRQPIDVVLAQSPKGGRLSSFDEVTLVLAKPLNGVVPNVEGATLRVARQRLRKVRLRAEIAAVTDGPPGRVIGQFPKSGVAAAPGMVVKLVVARG